MFRSGFIASVIFVAIIIVSCAACWAGQQAKRNSAGDEWIIEQERQILYVSKDAVKIAVPEYGFEVLTRAPDWKVVAYRKDEKTQWRGELDQFGVREMFLPFVTDVDKRFVPAIFVGSATWNKHKCSVYVSAGLSKSERVYASDEIPISKQGAELISRWMHKAGLVPKVPLLSLRSKPAEVKMVRKAKSRNLPGGKFYGEHSDPIHTLSLKRVPFNKADFEAPSNYKQTANLKLIAYSKSKKSEVTDFFEDLGYMSKRQK